MSETKEELWIKLNGLEQKVMQAVKDELMDANQVFFGKRQLRSKDYFVVGVVAAALKRITELSYDPAANH